MRRTSASAGTRRSRCSLPTGTWRGPLIGSELRETIQGEIDAFADADAGGAGQQEGIGGQVVGAAQFLLQELIVWWRQRFGQIVGPWGEVLAANQVRREGVAVGGEVVEYAAEADQIVDARLVAQGRLLCAQPAEPAEQVGVAAQLGKPAELRKVGVEIAQENLGQGSVVADGGGPQGEGKSLEVSFQDLFQGGGLAHETSGRVKRVRLATARAYSRQTSWGASWT